MTVDVGVRERWVEGWPLPLEIQDQAAGVEL